MNKLWSMEEFGLNYRSILRTRNSITSIYLIDKATRMCRKLQPYKEKY